MGLRNPLSNGSTALGQAGGSGSSDPVTSGGQWGNYCKDFCHPHGGPVRQFCLAAGRQSNASVHLGSACVNSSHCSQTPCVRRDSFQLCVLFSDTLCCTAFGLLICVYLWLAISWQARQAQLREHPLHDTPTESVSSIVGKRWGQHMCSHALLLSPVVVLCPFLCFMLSDGAMKICHSLSVMNSHLSSYWSLYALKFNIGVEV